ncbi:MAG: caspase family protein [Hyphomicrobiaceae bacterium]
MALLIGNKGYTAKVGPLENPHNDVDLVEAALRKVGFKVTVLKDVPYKQMDIALKRYATEVRRAGRGALSFFYYSGHGASNPETQLNYLIPVDVADADDDKVWFESLQQTTIIDLLANQAPAATHYLVFDACRNELNVSGPNAKALGTEKGFVPVADTSGLLIAYSTAPKRTASDAGDGGGPYAKVLASEMIKPNIEAVTMFRNVQLKVKQSIGQDPWLSFPSLPEVYFAGRSDETAIDERLRAAEEERNKLRTDRERMAREREALASQIRQLEMEAEVRAKGEHAKQKAERDAVAQTLAQERDEYRARLTKLEAEAEALAAQVQANAEKRKITALNTGPSGDPSKAATGAMDTGELTLVLQAELKRVGCDPGNLDGQWGGQSRAALSLFNSHAGLSLAIGEPSVRALDAVKEKKSRICPAESAKAERGSVAKPPGGAASSGSKASGATYCGAFPCRSTATHPDGRKVIITTVPESPF